ncbi:hypothetical protein HDU98_005512 [Podochytrium sp. JEL0797]|nr:hypothetical protein HDU98_005512 [Podochytrium sp. JEL0797]
MVERLVYSKTVTVWRNVGGAFMEEEDAEERLLKIDFNIPINEKCPSSVLTDCYSVEYFLHANLYTLPDPDSSSSNPSDDTSSLASTVHETRGARPHTKQSHRHQHQHRGHHSRHAAATGKHREIVPASAHVLATDTHRLKVQSVRSLSVLEALDTNVCVVGESIDTLVGVTVQTLREEVVMVEDWEVEKLKDCQRVERRFVEVDVCVTGCVDVERVESVDCVWRQGTEFRFVALKEDMENRQRIKEKARLEHVRKIGDLVTVHIPSSTKTVTAQPTTTKKPRNLRISTCSSDIVSLYDGSGMNSANPYSGGGAGGARSAVVGGGPKSPFRRFSKRKSSLPDAMAPYFGAGVGPVEEDGLLEEGAHHSGKEQVVPGEKETEKAGGAAAASFKPFSFLRKLVSGGSAAVGGGHSSAGSGSSGGEETKGAAGSRDRTTPRPTRMMSFSGPTGSQDTIPRTPPIPRFSGTNPEATLVPQIKQDLKYMLTTGPNGAVTRSLSVKIRVPILPKDLGAKAVLLPSTRVQEVTRTHCVVVRVKYRVKKDRVQGPLRHDRYVEVMVPLRLVHLRV